MSSDDYNQPDFWTITGTSPALQSPLIQTLPRPASPARGHHGPALQLPPDPAHGQHLAPSTPPGQPLAPGVQLAPPPYEWAERPPQGDRKWQMRPRQPTFIGVPKRRRETSLWRMVPQMEAELLGAGCHYTQS